MHPIVPCLAKAAAGGLVLGGLIDYAVSKKNISIYKKGYPTVITVIALVALRALHFCLGQNFYPVLSIAAMISTSAIFMASIRFHGGKDSEDLARLIFILGIGAGISMGKLRWKEVSQ